MNIKSFDLQHAGCMLFWGYVFFFDIIERAFGHWFSLGMVMAAALLCFMALQKGEDRYLLPKNFAVRVLPWIAFMLLFVIPRNRLVEDGNYWSTIRWILSVIMMILVAYKPLTYKGILGMIALYTGVHTAATWILYFRPSLYKGLFEFWGGWATGTDDYAVYKAGITGNYSRSSIAQIPGLFVLAAVIIVILFSKEALTRLNTGRLIAAAAAFVLVSGALVLVAKRSGLLFGMAAILMGYMVYKYRRINAVRIAGIAVLMILVFLAASRFVPPLQVVLTRFMRLGKDSSTTNRFKMWRLALEMFARSPLIGNGWESFKFEYYLRISNRTGGLYDYLDAHNVFLQVLAETGLIGGTIFIACIGSAFMTAYRLLQSRDRIPMLFDRVAVVYSFMYQIYFILYCATGNCLYDITFMHYMLAVGLMLGVYKKTAAVSGQAREIYETNRYFDFSQSI